MNRHRGCGRPVQLAQRPFPTGVGLGRTLRLQGDEMVHRDEMRARETSELSLDHRQVMAFVDAYLREYGHLPVAAEVARGCGFRSARPVDRLVRDLEADGYIRRDERYSRLGLVEMAVTPPLIDPAAQLFMTELAYEEGRAMLGTIRRGLDLAPDTATVTHLHAEGVARAASLLAYEDTRQHLANAGVHLDPSDEVVLEEHRGVLEELLLLYTDWDAFCLARLVWNLSALDWLETIDPIELGYVGASYVASRRTKSSLLTSYHREASRALASDPRLDTLFDQVASLIGRFRRDMAHHYPLRADQLTVDVTELLRTSERTERRTRPPRLG
jgi:hypothetical protein